MKWTILKNPKKKKNIRQNEICRGKPRHEGVEKVDTLRQNQDFDEVTRCINSMVKHFALQSQLRCPRFFGVQSIHRHKNALKRAVFLVGSEFRLRVPFGTRFVSQALPRFYKCVKSDFLIVCCRGKPRHFLSDLCITLWKCV